MTLFVAPLGDFLATQLARVSPRSYQEVTRKSEWAEPPTVSHLAPGRSAGAAPRVAGALGTADGGGASCHLTAAAATTSITDASR